MSASLAVGVYFYRVTLQWDDGHVETLPTKKFGVLR